MRLIIDVPEAAFEAALQVARREMAGDNMARR
jgi:hypothetical protein